MTDQRIEASANWLCTVQNRADGGWGMYEHDPSRIVTTAEAVTALGLAGSHGAALERGVQYLVDAAGNARWCQYLRHHAWIVYALVAAGRRDAVPKRCVTALRKAVRSGPCSDGPGRGPSLFATFLCVRALRAYEPEASGLIKPAADWVAAQARSGQWELALGVPSPAATSFALLTLAATPDASAHYSRDIDLGVDFLRRSGAFPWPLEHESYLAGDGQYNFHHFALAWATMALVACRVSIWDDMVSRAVHCLYHHYYSATTGGWAEEAGHRPSVFGTSHVISCFTTVLGTFGIATYLDRCNLSHTPAEVRPHVFVVHGHDDLARLQVEQFLTQTGCEPIVLRDQTDAGLNTMLQKFLQHASRAAYAVVIATPDDFIVSTRRRKTARARQNVLFELGFFMGRLGADRVCLARKGNVEIPSDLLGVHYLDLDQEWRIELARKLAESGICVKAGTTR